MIPPSAAQTNIVANNAELVEAYLDHLRARACAAGTIRNARLYLGNLRFWLKDHGNQNLWETTRTQLEDYQVALTRHRRRDGGLLAPAGQHVRLTVIRGLFRWLLRQGHIASDPSAWLELPRLGRRLPKAVLSVAQVEAVLDLPALDEPSGLRDRAILEVLYCTGIRRSELCKLKLEDLDLDRRSLWVREGKGRKDRVVPLGRRASHWLAEYLQRARSRITTGAAVESRAVFLGKGGQPLSSGVLGQLVHRYIRRIGSSPSGSCHLLRHAMATHMLEGGADIRYIQHMLGHARLSTTELYTHVVVGRLAAIHRRTHPAERKFAALHADRCEHCGQRIRAVRRLPDFAREYFV